MLDKLDTLEDFFKAAAKKDQKQLLKNAHKLVFDTEKEVLKDDALEFLHDLKFDHVNKQEDSSLRTIKILFSWRAVVLLCLLSAMFAYIVVKPKLELNNLAKQFATDDQEAVYNLMRDLINQKNDVVVLQLYHLANEKSLDAKVRLRSIDTLVLINSEQAREMLNKIEIKPKDNQIVKHALERAKKMLNS